MFQIALGLSLLLVQTYPAEKVHVHARRLLEEGDGIGAEAAAREALAMSDRFSPEQEITGNPEKGLIFEDMIDEARSAYRRRRARYFLALGRSLSLQERWEEARKALRRSAALDSSGKPLLAMATHPDLNPAERIHFLLTAYPLADVQPEVIRQELVETKVFESLDTIQALLDRERLVSEVASDHPGMDIRVEALPDFRFVSDRGTFSSSELLSSGIIMVIYFPLPGGNRLSEEMDGLRRAVSEARGKGKVLFLAAFVPDSELATIRRIARLLTIELEVGRIDRLPEDLPPDSHAEIRVVARRGLLQVRIPVEDNIRSREIHRELSSALRFVEMSGDADSSEDDNRIITSATREAELEKLVTQGRFKDVLLKRIALLARLEAGPAPLNNHYLRIARDMQSVVREVDNPSRIVELMTHLTVLRGAGEAKARAFKALDQKYGQKLLEAARKINPAVAHHPPGDRGVFRLAVAGSSSSSGAPLILMQRSLLADGALHHFNFVLESRLEGINVVWTGEEPHLPGGVIEIPSGGAFLFEMKNGCRGVRLVEGQAIRYEGFPAWVHDGQIVEEKSALVDSAETEGDIPSYYHYIGRDEIGGGESVNRESSLERGLRMFQEGEYEAAASAFETAVEEIDPHAPYDETDLRFNRARCLEALGNLPEALALFRSIGDAVYQPLVNQRIQVLAQALRR